jgi:cell wall-associated NlpC family hydrolase
MVKIEDILKYAKSLVGLKYTWWKSGSTTKDKHPFYVDAIPTKTYIKKNGICCAGLINIMRQKAGYEVPGIGIYKGGTYSWYKYLKKKKVLEKFDDNKNYPLGTLFLRKYRNAEDQGHVSVYIKKGKIPKKPLYGEIIHAYAEDENGGKVGITSLGASHFTLKNGYYEYAILPKNWLFLE